MSPGSWHQDFIDELRSFPEGTKDDQVDALSRAFITLSEYPSSGRRLFGTLLRPVATDSAAGISTLLNAMFDTICGLISPRFRLSTTHLDTGHLHPGFDWPFV